MAETGRDKTQQVSDLMDGRLRGQELAQAVERVAGAAGQDAAAQMAWREYHLVGETLRLGRRVPLPGTPGLAQRVAVRIAAEAAIPHSPMRPHPVMPAGRSGRSAANAPWFDWRMVAGVAVLSVAGMVGWNMTGSRTGGAELAQLPPATQVASVSAIRATNVAAEAAAVQAAAPEAPVMVRDPHLDALLAAHKQFGGTSALQKPSGFLRNATFEGRNR